MRRRIPKTRGRGSIPAVALVVAVVAIMGLAFAAAPALAQDEEESYAGEPDPTSDMYAQPGFYAQGMATFGFELFENETRKDAITEFFSPALLPLIEVENSLGANGRVGYRAHKHIAVEAEFEWMNDFNIQTKGQIRLGRARLWNLTGNVKGYLLTGRVQPYVLAGAGYGQADVTSSLVRLQPDGFVMRFGGGVDIYANEDFGVALEGAYVLPTGKLTDYNYVSVGIGFFLRFYGGS